MVAGMKTHSLATTMNQKELVLGELYKIEKKTSSKKWKNKPLP